MKSALSLLPRGGWVRYTIPYPQFLVFYSGITITVPKSFDYFPPEGECSEGLDAFRFFFNSGGILKIYMFVWSVTK